MAVKYLATGGVDTPAAGTIGTPFATYDYALLHTTDDDLILVRGGTYNQFINNTACNGLSVSAYRRVANYPGEVVWMAPTSGSYVLHFFSSQTYIEFDGINIDARGNVYGAPIRLEGWEFGDPHHIRIKNAEIISGSDGVNPVDPTTGGPMGILAQAVFPGRTGCHEFLNLRLMGGGDPGDYSYGMYIETHDCVVDGCEFDDTGNAGIQIYNYYGLSHGFRPMRNIVRNSYFHDIHRTPNGNLWGIIDAGDQTKIYNNRFLRIGGTNGAAILLYTSLNPEVYHNAIYDGATRGVHVDTGASGVTLRNNIAFQNWGGNYLNLGVGTIADHNMFSTTNPQWVNASAGDFTLQATSPAIGAGITVPYATSDYLGTARGTPSDIGAAEHIAAGIGTPVPPVRVNVVANSDFTATTLSAYASLPIAVTAGNTLVVAAGAVGPGVVSVAQVTDTAGNTYTKAGHVFDATDRYREEIWIAKNVLPHAANVVSVLWSNGVQYRGIIVVQYSGLDPVTPFDGTASGAVPSGASVTTGTLTSPRPNAVHLILPRWGLFTIDTITWPPGFSADFSPDPTRNTQISEKFVAAPYTGTYTLGHTNTTFAKLALVVSLAPVEALPDPPLRVTQLAAEIVTPVPPSPLAVSQLVTEVLAPVPPSPLAITQVAAELVLALPPQPDQARVTQLACELIIVPTTRPLCVVDFPVDPD